MVIPSVAQVQICFDLTPLISIDYSYASEAYFHNCVSISTKTPLLKVKTITECGPDIKCWHNQQQFCHYIL